MFVERLISGAILLVAIIGVILYGGDLLFAVSIIVSLRGMYELYRAVHMEKTGLAIVGYVGAVGYYILMYGNNDYYILHGILVFMLLLLTVYVMQYPKYTFEQIAYIIFGIFYVPVMLSCIYRVRCMEDGWLIVWLILIGAWGSDTCAYCVGKLIGKHKLPSKLSPNKSVEGCIGGLAGAALIGAIYGYAMQDYITTMEQPYIMFAIMGGCASVVSQIGDLAASAIKRNVGIKDYGRLIPGHGGVLDRFDSIIFTAPLIFVLAEIL